MTPPHGLRLVSPASPAAPRLSAVRVSLSEPRLRVMTAGRGTFGTDWDRTLAMQSHEFLSHHSAESLIEHLAAERRYVGLVGVNPRTEPNLFGSIAAAADSVLRRLVLVAPKMSEDLTRRLLSVGDFVTAETSIDEVIVRLQLRTLKSCGAAPPRAPELDPGLEEAPYGPSSGAETTDQALRVRFTPIESRLYALFAQRFGEAISREEILHVVWDRTTRHAKASNIVDVYVRYLRVKLERAAPHLKIVTVRDVGYGICEKTSTLASPRLKGWSAQ